MNNYLKYLFRAIFYYPADFFYYLLSFKKKYGISFGGYQISKQYPDYLSSHNAKRGIESFAFKFVKGNSIDIGAGPCPLPGTRGIDNSAHENAYKIKEENNSVDFVFSSHCFEHLETPENSIKEVKRILKKDGHFLLYLPHPACELWSKKVNENHVSFFWPHEWEVLLINQGFQVKNMTYQPDGMMSFFILATF